MKEKKLSEKEIEYYLQLWSFYTREDLVIKGRKRLKECEAEFFGRSGNTCPDLQQYDHSNFYPNKFNKK